MKVILIRHGATKGNETGKYIGKTDEPLARYGINQLKSMDELYGYPEAQKIVVSPMKRCLETARLIYPGGSYEVISDLRECDFGDFEGKNYVELSDNPDYQKWLDSNGTSPFPNGDSAEVFKKRCQNAFLEQVEKCQKNRIPSVAFIIHGGTIMSILEKYAVPKKEYYDYQSKNAEGYIFEWNGKEKRLENGKKLTGE